MTTKRNLDKFDLEAEREGIAICKSNELNIRPLVSKRLQKNRSKTQRGLTIQTNKILKQYIK